ncbi:MAG: ABC1 kinase family protein [Oligoflexus sp.]
MKTSWVRRSLGTASVLGQVSRGVLQGKVNGWLNGGKDEAGKQKIIFESLTKQLGQYKGLMMKIGQAASYMDLSLPDEMRQVLARLQDQVEPIAHDEIEKVFQEEFGLPPQTLFHHWEPIPVAAASIGQVHRAVTKEGQQVAVKVQYPGIVKAVKNDFRGISALTSVMKPIFKGLRVNELVEEVWAQLEAECDYIHEAKNQMEMKRLFADDPQVVIPGIVPTYSTKRILCSEWIDGQRFENFRQTSQQTEKNAAGSIISHFYLTSALKHGVFNGDPHPGNYLFLPGKVCFLDYGHVKRWESDKKIKLRNLWQASINHDREAWDKAFFALHQPVFKKNYDTSFYYHFYVDTLLMPYSIPHYRFHGDYFKGVANSIMWEQPFRAQVMPDKDLIIWMRQIFGVNAVLSLLESESDFRFS